MTVTPARHRVLTMLEQRGPMRRHDIGFAFAKKDRMWTQAATRLAGFLCRPLLDGGLITESRNREGFHQHMAITKAGRDAIRDAP